MNEEQIEEMTRLIHTNKADDNSLIRKRGHKSKSTANDEQLVQVSVDLPESIFIHPKVLVIQQKTNLKSYAHQVVEYEMTTPKS